MNEAIDPLLLQMVGQRLSPIRAIKRFRCDGFENLEIVLSEISNVEILGGQFVKPAQSQGQSLKVENAISGALGEALERHGATCIPFRTLLIRGTYSELNEKYPIFALAETQLFTSDQLDAPGFDLRNVEPDDTIDWQKGTLLKGNKSSEVYFPYPRTTLDSKKSYPFDIATTNGLALGSSFEQATQSALCEYIERASFLETWWLKKSPPLFTSDDCLDLPSPFIRKCAQWMGKRLFILDLTETWGVPAFAGLICGRSGEPPLTIAAAAHADAHVAFQKSLEELTRIFYGRMLYHKTKERIIPQVPYEKSIQDFSSIENLYWSEQSQAWTQFLFHGERPGKIKLKTRLSQDRVLPAREVLNRGGQILTFDMTPVDLASAGLSLARVIVPEGVSLNCAHRARPWGSPGLRSYSIAQLNPIPHPFL